MKAFGHPLVRAAMAALCLAAGVIGAAATSRALTGRRAGTPPAEVLPVRVSEVRRIAIVSPDKLVELARAENGTWSGVTGASRETEALMSDIQERLFPLQGYRSLAADTASPDYGLASPEITFRVEDGQGRSQTVLLGAPTFTSGGVYARRSSEAGRLYLVPRRMMDDLRSLLTGRRVDTINDLPGKIREKAPKYDPTSWWLRQSLEAGGAP